MNYLILAASAIGKMLEKDPNLKRSIRKKRLGEKKILHLCGKRQKQKKANWLSKYQF